jgi:hypothetical protein
MERKKVVAVIPSQGEGSHKRCNVQLPLFSVERSFTSLRMTKPTTVIHDVVAKWNEKK